MDELSDVLIHSSAARTTAVSASLIPLIFKGPLIPATLGVIYIISSISK